MPDVDTAVAESAPAQTTDAAEPSFSGSGDFNWTRDLIDEANNGRPVEHSQSTQTDETPQGASTLDADDDVRVYDHEPQSVRDRVNKLTGMRAEAMTKAEAAEARASAAEAKAAELEARFENYVPPELEARGFKSRAELAQAIAAENKQREEADAAEKIRAYREEMHATWGEEYGEKLVKAELLNQETQRQLQAHQAREAEFNNYVSSQRAQEQATKIINSSLEKVPAAVHDSVRGLLSTVPVNALPQIADALTKLVHDAVNDTKSAYNIDKSNDAAKSKPTPEGTGGGSRLPTGAVDYRKAREMNWTHDFT